jgi:hypothetical protein
VIEYRTVFVLDTQESGGTGDIPISCQLQYDPDEPFTVNHSFMVVPNPVQWTYGRDILLDAMMQPTGVGDVKAWVDGEKFYLQLKSPEGQARIWCPTSEMEEFIRLMVLMVPLGEETIDFDSELQAFMEG